MSLIERCPHFKTQNVHNPKVQDSARCPDERGEFIFQGCHDRGCPGKSVS